MRKQIYIFSIFTERENNNCEITIRSGMLKTELPQSPFMEVTSSLHAIYCFYPISKMVRLFRNSNNFQVYTMTLSDIVSYLYRIP